ncbi:hypothetical protein Pla52o_19870 [Novipirellula galeiformis]|uniref:Uncharacterized protein n=1 Tax=Novipirellula galeiformis TaxID=2528004 RepID=A0A5C6CKR8_9BACT|nr:hypothetical protein [Novipirellula galeiformis]TWU24064.1 hypothetical protein Pla52o_19870 [Novipirellula galeiformis]
MKVCLTQRVRRFLLSCLIAGITVTGSYASDAVDVDLDTTQEVAPLSSTIDEYEAWCEWGTHDSSPVGTSTLSATSQDGIEEKHPNAPEQSAMMPALFAVAESVSRRAGISIQQLIEPFAMVTPYAQSSLEEISRLQLRAEESSTHDAVASSGNEVEAETATHYEGILPAPIVDTTDNHCFADSATTDEMGSDMYFLATEEPIDGDAPGHEAEGLLDTSNAMATNPPKSDSSVGSSLNELVLEEAGFEESEAAVEELAVASPVVGSGAIIATISEEYLPYDLAARDIPVWNFAPLVYKPYCILQRNNHVEKFDMWSEVEMQSEAGAEGEVEAEGEAVAVKEVATEEVASEEVHAEAVVVKEASSEEAIGEALAFAEAATNEVVMLEVSTEPVALEEEAADEMPSHALAMQDDSALDDAVVVEGPAAAVVVNEASAEDAIAEALAFDEALAFAEAATNEVVMLEVSTEPVALEEEAADKMPSHAVAMEDDREGDDAVADETPAAAVVVNEASAEEAIAEALAIDEPATREEVMSEVATEAIASEDGGADDMPYDAVAMEYEMLDDWSMGDESVDVVVAAEPASDAVALDEAEASQVVIECSADCLLDELVWKMDTLTLEVSRVIRQDSTHQLGYQLGSRFRSVVASGNQVTDQAVELLAGIWPVTPLQPVAESVGQALLVRAEAVAASEAAEQVAEVVGEAVSENATDIR